MSKFGWDLPPGVTTSMLPGNTPEDEAFEAFLEEIYSHLPTGLSIDADGLDKFTDWLWDLLSNIYRDGYQQGMADERMAKEFKEGEFDKEK